MPTSKLVDEISFKEEKKTDIKTLSAESDFVIFQTKSAIPFNPFPSTVVVTPTRITITIPNLFTREEYPVPIDFIAGARVFHSLLFSSLMLETFRYDTPPPVRFLKHKDAALARRYILALVDCWRNNVDISQYPQEQLIEKLLAIGKVERVK